MKRTAIVLLGVFAAGLFDVHAKDPNPERWEKTIAAFEKKDAEKEFAKGGVVFTGSSSIALWSDLGKYFPGVPVLNRGFGGSTIPEVNYYLDRTVIKHQPRIVVLFCGGNDVASSRSPEQVFADFQTFCQKIHAKLPDTKVLYLSIHRPPARVHLAAKTDKANDLIAAECKKNPKLGFVDIRPLMLGSNGMPNPELYRDPLHPNAKAYEMWAEKLRPLLKGQPEPRP